MSDRRAQRVLFYSNNGTGLGHLTRQLNIGRIALELARAMGLPCDFRFLTTSDAAHVANDFPVYKIPSKTTIARSDASSRSFRAHAQLFVANLTGQFSPDLLVMDTMPQGSHGEFTFLRENARRTLFVDRRKKPEVAASPIYQSHLALYDRILVPDLESEAGNYPLPANLRSKRRFVGPIHGYRQEESLSREEVRSLFGVSAQQRVIYFSSGGGGDELSETWMKNLIETLARDADNFILAGYGPLFRGRLHYAPNVIPLQSPDIRRFFGGLDLAFSAAGYNSWHELLAAGVPCSFFSLSKGLDQQDHRIEGGCNEGWHRILTGPEPFLIHQEFEALIDPGVRQGIALNLATRNLPDGALNAAVELLLLLPGVDRVRCLETARLYSASRQISGPHRFSQIWPWSRFWLDKLLGPVERTDFLVQVPADQEPEGPIPEWVLLGRKTLELCGILQLEPGPLRGLLSGLARDMKGRGLNAVLPQAMGLVQRLTLLAGQVSPQTAVALALQLSKKLKEPLAGLRDLAERAASGKLCPDSLLSDLERTGSRLDDIQWQSIIYI